MALRIFALFFFLASAAVAQTASTKPYAYAGFSLETDWQGLTARFPRSTHEFLESYSGITHSLAADGAEAFQQALGSASGKYRIRLAATEPAGGLYFLEFDMVAGKAQALKLSFEKPEAYFKTPFSNQDERFPACGPILSSLTTQYGKPANGRSWTEEALEHSLRTWQSGSEKLSFDCGQ